MEELTIRDYPIGMSEQLIGTNGKQATDRKLTKYGYGFTSTGRGTTRIYTITSLPNAFYRFRSYCVFSLGYSPNTDFVKLRDFLYLLLGDEDFNWLPDEAKEEYTHLIGKGISRQTIANYTKQLEKTGFIDTIFRKCSERFFYLQRCMKMMERCSKSLHHAKRCSKMYQDVRWHSFLLQMVNSSFIIASIHLQRGKRL